MLEFFDVDVKDFQLLAEQIGFHEYSTLTSTTQVPSCLDACSVTKELNLADNTLFIKAIQHSSFAPVTEAKTRESVSTTNQATNESNSNFINDYSKASEETCHQSTLSVVKASQNLSKVIKNGLQPKIS